MVHRFGTRCQCRMGLSVGEFGLRPPQKGRSGVRRAAMGYALRRSFKTGFSI